jgi:chemotaxis protein MotB
MAIMRRNSSQISGSIWPGFVDAMTALLMILMFVLTIFMVVQFVLRETITGQDVELDNLTDQVAIQDAELNNLSAQIAGLAQALGLEQTRAEGLEGALDTSQGALQSAEAQIAQQSVLIAGLTSETADQKSRISSFEQQVAGLLGERDNLTVRLNNTQATLDTTQASLTASQASLDALENLQTKTLTEKEAVQLALAQARSEIDVQTEQARLAAAKREALQALIVDLKTDVSTRDARLASIARELDQTEQKRLAEIAAVLALKERLATSDAELVTALGGLETTAQELAASEGQLATLQTDFATKLAELEQSTKALSEAEKLRLIELASIKALRDRLKGSQDELTAMTLALEGKRKQAEDTLTLLAAAQAAQNVASDLADRRLTDQEKEAALLAQANALLRDEQALSADSQRKVALLNQQTNALRGQLNALQGLLDTANAQDTEAQIQIESLGANLNSALAKVAAEQKRRAQLEEIERKRLEAEAVDLKKFRSEFFGRLRDVLGAQDGIRIVGDRFVFSSEVLFSAGSADLGDGGKVEIRKIADIILDVAQQIPPEIDWILRVDGHTDNTPLSGFGQFRDNWELSQARALAVVRYLIDDLGIPANRLAANGFGEFQPVTDGVDPEALALNRRIELKFTEK